MPWTPPDIPTDEDDVTQRLLDGMQDRVDGWTPHEGQVDVAMLEEVGRENTATNALAVEVINQGVAGFGETAFQLPARLEVSATLDVELTVTETGVQVPDGLVVVGPNAIGAETAFVLLEPVTATGTTFTTTFTAVYGGTSGNGVTGDLQIITASTDVLSATASDISGGGEDAETLTGYLTRLVDFLSVLRPGGVRASDLAVLARSVPGVQRAVGLDLYNPISGETDAERTATVFVVSDTGQPVGAGITADVYDVLEAAREPNFQIFVEDPTYTAIDVAFTATADPGADPALVHDDVVTAIAAFISPAAWGTTDDDPEAWIDRPVVRLRARGLVPGDADPERIRGRRHPRRVRRPAGAVDRSR